MERTNAIHLARSPAKETLAPISVSDSQISALLLDISQQLDMGMQNLLKKTSEIEQSANEIVEEIDRCKESATETSKVLQEEKERFQKLAISVIEMLNGGAFN